MGEPQSDLATIQVLSRLDETELRAIAGACTPRTVQAGEVVIDHLDQSQSVYFVVSGQFRVQIFANNGRMVALRTLGRGQHFGELAALSGAPRAATVVADSAGELLELPGVTWRSFLETMPRLAMALLEAMARQVTVLGDRVYELAALETRFRLYLELLRLARGHRVTPLGIIIAPAPTHEQIAQSIGAQREAVTRELRQLGKEGVLLHRRGEIVIKREDELRQRVERRAGLAASYVMDWG